MQTSVRCWLWRCPWSSCLDSHPLPLGSNPLGAPCCPALMEPDYNCTTGIAGRVAGGFQEDLAPAKAFREKPQPTWLVPEADLALGHPSPCLSGRPALGGVGVEVGEEDLGRRQGAAGLAAELPPSSSGFRLSLCNPGCVPPSCWERRRQRDWTEEGTKLILDSSLNWHWNTSPLGAWPVERAVLLWWSSIPGSNWGQASELKVLGSVPAQQ